MLFVVCFWRYDWCFDEDQHHKRTNLVKGIKFLFVSDDITDGQASKQQEPATTQMKLTQMHVY